MGHVSVVWLLTEARAATDIVVRSAFGKIFNDSFFGFLEDLNAPEFGFLDR
jgi:hypothetical protein